MDETEGHAGVGGGRGRERGDRAATAGGQGERDREKGRSPGERGTTPGAHDVPAGGTLTPRSQLIEANAWSTVQAVCWGCSSPWTPPASRSEVNFLLRLPLRSGALISMKRS